METSEIQKTEDNSEKRIGFFTLSVHEKLNTPEAQEIHRKEMLEDIANKVYELNIKDQSNAMLKGELLSAYYDKYPRRKARLELFKDKRVDLQYSQAEKTIKIYKFINNDEICSSNKKQPLYKKLGIEKLALLLDSNIKERFIELAEFIDEDNTSVKELKMLIEKIKLDPDCSFQNAKNDIKNEIEDKKKRAKNNKNNNNEEKNSLKELKKQLELVIKENTELKAKVEKLENQSSKKIELNDEQQNHKNIANATVLDEKITDETDKTTVQSTDRSTLNNNIAIENDTELSTQSQNIAETEDIKLDTIHHIADSIEDLTLGESICQV